MSRNDHNLVGPPGALHGAERMLVIACWRSWDHAGRRSYREFGRAVPSHRVFAAEIGSTEKHLQSSRLHRRHIVPTNPSPQVQHGQAGFLNCQENSISPGTPLGKPGLDRQDAGGRMRPGVWIDRRFSPLLVPATE